VTSGVRPKDIELEVVVSHYDSLDFELLPPLLPEARFTVYDKSGKYEGECVRLENVGREGDSYLTHIIGNYDSLAGRTVFIQDDVLSHRPDVLPFVAEVISERSPFRQFPCTWGGGRSIRRRVVRDGICDLHTLGRPDMIRIACEELCIDLPSEYSTETCAFFSATDEAIRTRGREFYEKVRNWLLRSKHHGYALEHMWKLVF